MTKPNAWERIDARCSQSGCIRRAKHDMAYYNGLYYELVKICDYCLANYNYQGQKEGGKKCFTH